MCMLDSPYFYYYFAKCFAKCIIILGNVFIALSKFVCESMIHISLVKMMHDLIDNNYKKMTYKEHTLSKVNFLSH